MTNMTALPTEQTRFVKFNMGCLSRGMHGDVFNKKKARMIASQKACDNMTTCLTKSTPKKF